jgi:hypothetical protein
MYTSHSQKWRLPLGTVHIGRSLSKWQCLFHGATKNDFGHGAASAKNVDCPRPLIYCGVFLFEDYILIYFPAFSFSGRTPPIYSLCIIYFSTRELKNYSSVNCISPVCCWSSTLVRCWQWPATLCTTQVIVADKQSLLTAPDFINTYTHLCPRNTEFLLCTMRSAIKRHHTPKYYQTFTTSRTCSSRDAAIRVHLYSRLWMQRLNIKKTLKDSFL